MIEKILSGQKDLYADFVRRYKNKVMGYCRSTLQNYSEAEDAAQVIFVKAYLSLGKFKGRSSFSTWLYRIAANHCFDILRKRNRRRTVSLDNLVENEGEKIHKLFSTSPGVATGMENSDLVDKILSTLSPEYRTILTLREAGGLDYEEMAKVLECSLDSVKGRLARARKQLHENLRLFVEKKDVYKVGIGGGKRGVRESSKQKPAVLLGNPITEKEKRMSKGLIAVLMGFSLLMTVWKSAFAASAGCSATPGGCSTSGACSPAASAQKVHPLGVGDLVPDGNLTTIEGEKVSFKSLISQKPTIIIFYRGSWCPFCNLQMEQLVKIEPELKNMGYQVLAITPDKPEKLKESLDKHQINYTLLSDRTMDLTGKFGLAYRVNQETLEKMKKYGEDLEVSTGNNLHLLPVPAAYVVDSKGAIRFVYYNVDIKVRVNPDNLIKAAKEALK